MEDVDRMAKVDGFEGYSLTHYLRFPFDGI